MAIDPGTGGAPDICWISPSDEAGQLDNILTRLRNLEIAVAKMAGLNVTATNASDLIEQLGVVSGGTIILGEGGPAYPNAPGDFTGTIISNGIMTIWENGTVRFEVDKAGVTTGGGGGIQGAYYLASDYDTNITAGNGRNPLTLDTELYDPAGLGSVSSNLITVAQTGKYLINANVYIDATSSTYFGDGNVYVGVIYPGLSNYDFVRYPTVAANNQADTHIFLTPTVSLTAGDTVGVRVFNNTTGTIQAYLWSLALLKL